MRAFDFTRFASRVAKQTADGLQVCSRKYNRLDVHYGLEQCSRLVQSVEERVGAVLKKSLGGAANPLVVYLKLSNTGEARLLQSGMLVNLPGVQRM